jgi:hypothetical protein
MKSVKVRVVPAVVAMVLGGCATSSTPTLNTTGTSSSTTETAAPPARTTSTTRVRVAHPLGPLGVVRRYWRDIAGGRFRVAYGFLAVGSVPQDQAQFASDEQRAQIQRVTFTGSLASATGASATVLVSSLTTTDVQYGCRTWSGEYQLNRAGHRWRITRASISPAACAIRGTSSGPATSTATATAPSSETVASEGPGSYSHAGDAQFCSSGTNVCIPNFPNGNGSVVQCADGEWSHSGGLSGACSDHGGEQ